ncbi:MAG: OmpH family outer membrane protein [Fibrobacteres bacterium]|jgi:outer membrane protein|nr:OmpH family outer membrane protein [Fibrobacterota bacterium]
MRSVFLSVLALSISVFAAEAVPRIGLVDTKAIFDGFKGTKEAQERFDKQVAAWEQDVADKQKELATLKDKFDKQGMMLSEERKRALQSDFMAKQADLQKMAQTLYGKDGKLVKENEKFTGPIIQKIRGIAQQVAKAEGYDLVLDRASGAVFYVGKEDWDLTQKVLDRLNADFLSTDAPAKDAPAPAAKPKAK